MKYENLDKVNTICQLINNYVDKLNKLENDIVILRLVDSDNSCFITIGAYPSCEHSLKDYAINLKQEIICYYKKEIAKLEKELIPL